MAHRGGWGSEFRFMALCAQEIHCTAWAPQALVINMVRFLYWRTKTPPAIQYLWKLRGSPAPSTALATSESPRFAHPVGQESPGIQNTRFLFLFLLCPRPPTTFLSPHPHWRMRAGLGCRASAWPAAVLGPEPRAGGGLAPAPLPVSMLSCLAQPPCP